MHNGVAIRVDDSEYCAATAPYSSCPSLGCDCDDIDDLSVATVARSAKYVIWLL